MTVIVALPICAAAGAQESQLEQLRRQVAGEREALESQLRAIQDQAARLQTLEDRLLDMIRGTGVPGDAVAQTSSRIERVGEAPPDEAKPAPQVAVLADQGGVITRKGRLTLEPSMEYTRADRNRIIFRGIEVPQSVLVGVFDINESRQDVLTAALTARYGLTNRLEANIRVPYVYRSDVSVLSPVSASPDSQVGTRDYSVNVSGPGDVEFGLRYQWTDGLNGSPYLIAGVQVLAPTGTNPFTVDRDNLGNATRAATGSGFFGVSPSVTVLLPTDPAVIFGSIGYTHNFGRDIGRFIGDTFIEHVQPGGEPSMGFGVGVSLNPRIALSFAYAHTWSMGTATRVRVRDGSPVPTLSGPIESSSRDLQLGRFMFGVSYRLDKHRTFNWNLELGATDDAADVRTTFRVPVGSGN